MCSPSWGQNSSGAVSIGNGLAEVQTIEHLMSSLSSLGVDNIDVEMSLENELPGLDSGRK